MLLYLEIKWRYFNIKMKCIFIFLENVFVIMISFQGNQLQIFPTITSNNFMIQNFSFQN
jgi:hypothetical protein